LESGSLNLTIGALYVVAAMKGEDQQDARNAVIKAAREGRVTRSVAKAIIEEHRDKQNLEFKEFAFAYCERFGGDESVNGVMDAQFSHLMKASLLSGVDEPELVERKRKHKEHLAELDRKHAEFLATPITAETEQEYTGRIKQRRLYEGACDLSWEQYFKYRDQHPDCEPLTPDDLAYAALWTACAVVPPEPIKPLDKALTTALVTGNVEGVREMTALMHEDKMAAKHTKDKTVSVEELKEKLKPIIAALMIEGKKNMATVSFSAILHQAGMLEKLLKEWTK
jgi:hypothetical protein